MKPFRNETISLWQLFVLIFLFTTGNSLVLNIGPEAKHNGWIAILLASFCGVVILYFQFHLSILFPGKNLFEIIEKGYGKLIGKMISFGYICFFFISAGLVIRNLGELMVNTIFTKTPIEVILLTFTMTCAYILNLGIEVLGRSAEVFIPYYIIFLLFIGAGLLISNQLFFHFLEPFIGDGFLPIINAIFPYHLTFPFSEFLAFLVVIPSMGNIRKARKWGIWAVITSGIVLCYSALLQIMTLGPLKERANFPLLSASTEISLLKFIERVDLLVVFIMMLGILVKASIFFYAGLKGLEYIFSIPYRSFLFPMSPIITFTSLLIGATYAEYANFGKLFSYIQLPFYFFFPFLLLLMGIFIQRKKGGNRNETF